MTYAIDRRARVGVRVRPFRLLAAVLCLIVFFMLFAILSVPTYERELAAAKEAYQQAAAENERLTQALDRLSSHAGETVMSPPPVSAP